MPQMNKAPEQIPHDETCRSVNLAPSPKVKIRRWESHAVTLTMLGMRLRLLFKGTGCTPAGWKTSLEQGQEGWELIFCSA